MQRRPELFQRSGQRLAELRQGHIGSCRHDGKSHGDSAILPACSYRALSPLDHDSRYLRHHLRVARNQTLEDRTRHPHHVRVSDSVDRCCASVIGQQGELSHCLACARLTHHALGAVCVFHDETDAAVRDDVHSITRIALADQDCATPQMHPLHLGLQVMNRLGIQFSKQSGQDADKLGSLETRENRLCETVDHLGMLLGKAVEACLREPHQFSVFRGMDRGNALLPCQQLHISDGHSRVEPVHHRLGPVGVPNLDTKAAPGQHVERVSGLSLPKQDLVPGETHQLEFLFQRFKSRLVQPLE